MRPAFTVLIPTHDHAHLLRYAIMSALSQNLNEIEVFVVGDGAGPKTSEVVEELAKNDQRLYYFDMPKGERHGERNRHYALQEARGKYVAYLCDDDLWRSDHLDNILLGMADADFVHTLHTSVMPDGKVDVLAADLALSKYTLAMLLQKTNFFGPTVAAHSLDAYRNLPYGWRPAPTALWTDLYMWRQFLEQPHLRMKSILVSDTLHFSSSARGFMSEKERELEIAQAYDRLSTTVSYNTPKIEDEAVAYLMIERDLLLDKQMSSSSRTDKKFDMKFEQIRLVAKLKSLNFNNTFQFQNNDLNKQADSLLGIKEEQMLLLQHLKDLQFDGSYYLEQNPDVAEAGECPFNHFLVHGCREMRSYRFLK